MTILIKDANGNNQTVSTADEVVTAIAAQNALIGEVAANPTTNTLLERVKAVNTALGTTNTSLTTINTSVGTVNTSLGTVNTSVGAVTTAVNAVTTKLNASIAVTGPLTNTELRASAVGVVPQMASGGNMSVQTAATGSTYTAFASQACKQLTIVNDSGTTVLFQQGGTGVGVPVLDGTAFTIFGITNANQIGLKRKDDSNTQVTLAARWEA